MVVKKKTLNNFSNLYVRVKRKKTNIELEKLENVPFHGEHPVRLSLSAGPRQ